MLCPKGTLENLQNVKQTEEEKDINTLKPNGKYIYQPL
jgi:hypothetical protein